MRGKRRSAAANLKRSYWLRGKVQTYAEYKAKALGIVVRHVSPKNTSRQCSRCGSPIVRYNDGEPCEGYREGASLMYCPACGKRDHADRNAAINIGRRFLARYRKAPVRRLNGRGVGDAQEA